MYSRHRCSLESTKANARALRNPFQANLGARLADWRPGASEPAPIYTIVSLVHFPPPHVPSRRISLLVTLPAGSSTTSSFPGVLSLLSPFSQDPKTFPASPNEFATLHETSSRPFLPFIPAQFIIVLKVLYITLEKTQ